ncbi:Maf family protein [Alteromonas stellipolaris]|uniref:dTTP/UTP pyrophosphatase n=1 Tax=Alteromonas stellipolaris TaxID=233316 RepID=A0AAW7YYY9_9ALTE|nr:Maf family protein [Alteromonas stellipolaris]MBZ2160568.1 Maf family protein [Alteromonas stellipolaris]MCQ8847914.1 Maf family protein [Alteromonas stellipolaris]MDO6538549.1 Maf family protein [Alteromonas stellipolaris]MDO6577416.1 Maf family protein [Alteromonas stellipolaris]MDP2535313.1 Maf family protein [Alteromonas stellipolaris]
MNYSVVLASASPRRTMLLDQMGIAHSVKPVDIDESALVNETPEAQVARLAEQKAKTALVRLENEGALSESTRVLASDTLIAFNGVSLGKPEDKEDARRILSMLSDNQHEVLTAISVASTTKQVTQTITTKVTFAALTNDEIDAYWDTGEPADKAGSYAIQGIGGQFVKAINGSASAVVGLPLYETRQLLREFGVVS